MAWEAVIGLEVHVQLKTSTKIFCRCENRFGADANSLVCPVCLGYPGTLPVLNGAAVDLAVELALALGCWIRRDSVFARKNYFYADLPKGYQISQFDRPLAESGEIPLRRLDADGRSHPRTIRVHRIHMEEDAGKLLHETPGGGPLPGKSLIDFNRCGVPLVEIVSEPDMRTPEEAQEYLHILHQVLLYTGVSDGNMEEGSLRCDANVSIRPLGVKELGTKAEVKNLNSFRNVARAIEFEIERQTNILESGGEIEQETRSFDAATGLTRTMRSKEEAHDYRYFPEPDLRPLLLSEERIERLASSLPELPWAKCERFVSDYELSEQDARLLTTDLELANYFEQAVASYQANPKGIANWIMTDVLRELKVSETGLQESLPPSNLAELVRLVDEGQVSGSAGKEVFVAMWGSKEAAASVIARLGLAQIRDDGQLIEWVDLAVAENPAPMAELAAGKAKVVGFLVGQVMRHSKGRAEPERVRELLLERAEVGGIVGGQPEGDEVGAGKSSEKA
jgi:aspartyl-tRNA(Asn)/glutamyl-tRNA(Gln) amidotransferase subunit B